MIKTGEQVNVAVRGGVSGKVVSEYSTKQGTMYNVQVDGYEENFVVPESMIATYGVGQAVLFFSSTKKEWRVQGKIREVKYNTTTHTVEYGIWHEVIERFSSVPTPRISTVPEAYVVEAIDKYKEFKLNMGD